MMGKEYLKRKLNTVRHRVLLRYEYYEMKRAHTPPEVAIPLRVSQMFRGRLGWCTRAVDNLADRLSVRGFSNDRFGIGDIFSQNNADILFDSAILGALISACDFIYIMPNANGLPKMQVIDGSNATGILDTSTWLLKEGYAVLERDPDDGSPKLEAYFAPGYVDYVYNGSRTERVQTGIGYPLLIPIINRPDSKRVFGHSRISRICMSIQDNAEDVLTRINVLSEIASWPQKYVLGLEERAKMPSNLHALFNSLLRFDKDEDGGVPSVGQFAQMTMTPHLEAFRLYANNFSGETGLTVDDLGFVSDNPSSAEAIKASHESLRVTASKAQKSFSTGFINAGFVAACLRDNFTYQRYELKNIRVDWLPVIEPDAAMLSSIGDGAVKINQAIPGFFDRETLARMTGINTAEAETPSSSIDSFILELEEGDGQ